MFAGDNIADTLTVSRNYEWIIGIIRIIRKYGNSLFINKPKFE
jgi:hypothetical protein